MKQLAVLIVGAGPTGLMMACELARHNIPFRIIDKKLEPTEGSNATWIQTRTLEIFDILGIADEFLRLGNKCEAINFYANGESITNLTLTEIDSSFPFILMLPQSKTERLLEKTLEKYKIRVERSLELINIEQNNNEVISTVKTQNGKDEIIVSDFVIACDGANSTVREKCKIPFKGEDISEQFMVADARMSTHLPNNEIHVFFDKGKILPEKNTIFSAFPWGGDNYRLSANLYQEVPRQSFTAHEVKTVVAERTYGNYLVESVDWISAFWIRGKILDEMRQSSIFFAGDAAHIHSPAGGQGMNTGLQDAFNLAWKLALVIKGKGKLNLLESYQSERYPIVKNIVTQTDFYTNKFLFGKSFMSDLRKFSSKISKQPKFTKKITMDLTQLNIHYKNSPIIQYSSNPEDTSPKIGERLVNVSIDESKTLYDYLRNSLHNILIFCGNAKSEESLLKIRDLNNKIGKQFPDLIKTLVISLSRLNDVDNLIYDSTGQAHQKYCINEPSIYIIRPDNYICFYSKNIDSSSIDHFLHQYLQ